MWSSIAVILPSAFHGTQHGIGSWFRGNNTIDATNGHSWCAFPYKDSTPGFAIDLAQMSINTCIANAQQTAQTPTGRPQIGTSTERFYRLIFANALAILWTRSQNVQPNNRGISTRIRCRCV